MALNSVEPTPFFLLSGMGADERVFRAQKEAFPHLAVPEWIEPLPTESLAEYARRFAEKIDPGVPCFIGGASFGGMIAVEMLPHLDAKACFLIGSVRHSGELPRSLRLIVPFRKMIAKLPYGAIQIASSLIGKVFGLLSRPHLRAVLEQATSSKSSFFRWAVPALLSWGKTENNSTTPLFQIHGERDLVLPVRYLTPDKTVSGGGHVISMTHGPVVNRFLQSKMDEVNS